MLRPHGRLEWTGHGLGVSMEVYTSSDRQQKREAVNKLESAMALKRKPKLSEKA